MFNFNFNVFQIRLKMLYFDYINVNYPVNSGLTVFDCVDVIFNECHSWAITPQICTKKFLEK